jgi:hypothetical protein
MRLYMLSRVSHNSRCGGFAGLAMVEASARNDANHASGAARDIFSKLADDLSYTQEK